MTDHRVLATGSTSHVVPWSPADVARGAAILLIAAIVIMAPAIAIGAVVAGGLGHIGDSTPAAVLVLAAGIVLEVALVAIALKFSVAKYDCSWRDLGFRRPRKGGLWLPFAVIIGTYIIQAIYFLVVVLTGLYKVFPEAGTDTGPAADTAVVLPLFIISVLLFAPLAEEIFFRGFAFAGFRTRWGGFSAAIASGLLFSAVHLNVVLLIPFAAAGILLAWSYSYSDSLYPSIAAHFLFNAVFVGLNFGGETVGLVIGAVVAIAVLATVWAIAPAALAATMARRRNRGPVFWAIAASTFTWPAVALLWLTGSRKPSIRPSGARSGFAWLLTAFGAVIILLIISSAVVAVLRSDRNDTPVSLAIERADDPDELSENDEAGLSPAEVVATSGSNFSELESFQARLHITTDADDPSSTTEGQIAYRANEVAYSEISFAGEPALLFIPPDLYFRGPDGRWYVVSPWDQGIPRDELPEFGPDDQIIDYGWITDELSDIEQLPDETIDGEDYMRYVGTIELKESSSEAPSDTIGLRPFGITERTLDVQLWLHKETYLPRKIHLSESPAGGKSNFLTNATFEFFDYDQPITPPEPPRGARPWRDLQLPDAPCTGSQFASCLEAQTQLESIARDSCEGADKRVCLVPLGQVSPALVQHLVDHYRDQYGLTVAVLTPSAVPGEIANPLREQIDADTLIDYIGSLFPDPYVDPNAVLIGVTPIDLYDKDSHFRYLFGLRGTPTYPKAVISTFRMNPEIYGDPPNDELLFSRSRKLLSKYIGILFYGLPSSPDPRSPLYNSILGPSDLDNMEEPLPVPLGR